MKFFVLLVLFAIALAYRVEIVDGRCYAEAYTDTRKENKLWIDLSRYLVEDGLMASLATTCNGYYDLTLDQAKNTANKTHSCANPIGSANSVQFLNSEHLFFFFNPCIKFDHIMKFDFLNGTTVDHNDDPSTTDHYITHCRSMQSNEFKKSNLCLSISGQLVFFHERYPQILDVKPDLRAISEEVIERADLIYQDNINSQYGDYSLTLHVIVSAHEIIPNHIAKYMSDEMKKMVEAGVDKEYMDLLAASLFQLETFKINVDLALYSNFDKNGKDYSITIRTKDLLEGSVQINARFNDRTGADLPGFDKYPFLPSAAFNRFTLASLFALLASLFVLFF